MSVSRTISEIFSVTEWCDLENGGRSRSRSLKMAPFNRSYMVYSSIWCRFSVIWRWIILRPWNLG